MNTKRSTGALKGRKRVLTLIPITVVVLCLTLLLAVVILLPTVIPVSSVQAQGAGPQIDWIRQFGSTQGDVVMAICADSTGTYVAGYTDGALPGWTNSGLTDAFVRKYDASGNELWTRQFGSGTFDSANAICAYSGGISPGIYVAGYTYGTLPGQINAGQLDAFVRKYDASGNELWTRQFGSTKGEIALDICADSTGIYVAGCTDGALPGWTNSGLTDAFVRRYDANGQHLWTRQFGSIQDDSAKAISSTSTGIYVAGNTEGTLPGPNSSGTGTAFVRSYLPNGNEGWTRQFGDHISASVNDICAISPNIYVTGKTYGVAYVGKFSVSGDHLWTRGFPGQDANAICADSTGIYMAGWTIDALPGQGSFGGDDAFVRKYGASGDELWTRQFGTIQDDRANAICADSTGIYVGGWTMGALPGQSSSGSSDAFVVKVSHQMVTQDSILVYNGSRNADDLMPKIALDGSGGFYVAGTTDTIISQGPSFDGGDFVVLAYSSNPILDLPRWVAKYNGTANGIDITMDMAVTEAGAVFVTGLSEGISNSQSTGADYATVGYDKNGTEHHLWRYFPNYEGGWDEAAAIAVDNMGNVHVTGSSQHYGMAYYDYATVSYAPGGWPPFAVIDRYDGGQALAIAADQENNFYVTGYSRGAATDYRYKFTTIKYEKNLWLREWVRYYAAADTGESIAQAITTDASGNIYVTGQAYNGISTDYATVKYNSSGQQLWDVLYDGAGGVDYPQAIAVDSSGNVYVTGCSEGSGTDYDYATVKYNSSGQQLWVARYNSPGNGADGARAMALDASGNVYVTGEAYTTDTDNDYVTVKYDGSGREMWVARYNSPAGLDDYGTDIAVDSLGRRVYVTGTSKTNSTGWDIVTIVYLQGWTIYTPVGPTVHELGPVTLEYENVTDPGITTLTPFSTGPELPEEYIMGNPPTYFDISTTATYEGLVNVEIDYSEMTFDGPETDLRLLQQTASGWTDITQSVNPTNKTISGSATHLCLFAVVEPAHPPAVGPIIAPVEPVKSGTDVNASAEFTDASLLGQHSATWDWGDGITSEGVVVEQSGSGSVTGNHVYATAGVYTVKLTVQDDKGSSGESVFEYVVVYDPSAGFVTGGGWIKSPAGAYLIDPLLEGKATFGFVSKYKKGATTPTGQTEFQFKVADLNFHSDSYDWLVIAGAKAKYKGVGTINGEGNYGFMLSAIDAGLTPQNNDVDTFRIKIWDKDDNDTVVYDNKLGAPDDADPTTAIAGGSIVIHK